MTSNTASRTIWTTALTTWLVVFTLAAPASADSLKLYLNNPNGRTKPMDACDREVCSTLKTLIDGAKTRIDFAIYGMRDQSAIFEALRRAKKRGVAIRGVIDRDLEGKNYYSSTEELVKLIGEENISSDVKAEKELKMLKDQRQAEMLAKYGKYVPPCGQPDGFAGPVQCLGYDLGDQCLMAGHASREALGSSTGAIMHNKYFVIDGKKVWTGSTNISDSGTGGYNANLVTVVDSKQVAAWYTEEFETMFAGKYHTFKNPALTPRTAKLGGGVTIDVLFSPQDKPITNAVRPLIQNAKKRIDVSIFFLTNKHLTLDLIKAHQRGVKVRVIIDATAATNGYTKQELLRAAGIPVKVENWGGKMHMKSASIDSAHIITGSMNWTSAGEGGNDENTIIIHSKKHARQYEKFFDKIWKSIPDTWLKGRPDPESPDTQHACTDGVDNDFDHKADGADPGCLKDRPALLPLPPWKRVPKSDGNGLVKVLDGQYYTPTHPEYKWIIPTSWSCSKLEAEAAGLQRARKKN